MQITQETIIAFLVFILPLVLLVMNRRTRRWFVPALRWLAKHFNQPDIINALKRRK